MIEGLKPYPEYKESGLPWLGQVPSNWRVVRNGSLFGQRNQTGYGGLPILEVSLKTGVRVRDFENSTRKQVMSDLGKYKRAAKGDVAYNMMRMWQGAVGVSPVDGLVSPAYVVARPFPEVEPQFFVELFRTGGYMSEIDNCSHGIVKDRNRLYWDQFKQILSLCPPFAEQVAIVRFLDHANRKIDGFIRTKRKLIALLGEQKQAIIHRAVTRGLDPEVKLKPSGIPWLGDIPRHWEVRRLRHTIRGKLTYGANAAAEFENPEWPRYLRITDFRSDGSLKADTFRSLPPSVAKDYLVEPGDILLARSGATVGKAFLVEDITGLACHAGYLIRARPNIDLILPSFLFSFTQSSAFVRWKGVTFNIATIQNIGADKYADLSLPLPPLDEQKAILDSIDVALTPLRLAITRTERELALMQEYRTRLTADIVTGKLDVREAAAKLPEEAAPTPAEDTSDLSEETEPADEEADV